MSLARFGWEGSNVYVFYHVHGGIACCGCSLDGDYRAASEEEMIEHLRRHVQAGECVPPRVFSELRHNRDTRDVTS